MSRLISVFLLLAGFCECGLVIAAASPGFNDAVREQGLAIPIGSESAWQYALLATLSFGFAGLMWRKAAVELL